MKRSNDLRALWNRERFKETFIVFCLAKNSKSWSFGKNNSPEIGFLEREKHDESASLTFQGEMWTTTCGLMVKRAKKIVECVVFLSEKTSQILFFKNFEHLYCNKKCIRLSFFSTCEKIERRKQSTSWRKATDRIWVFVKLSTEFSSYGDIEQWIPLLFKSCSCINLRKITGVLRQMKEPSPLIRMEAVDFATETASFWRDVITWRHPGWTAVVKAAAT